MYFTAWKQLAKILGYTKQPTKLGIIYFMNIILNPVLV